MNTETSIHQPHLDNIDFFRILFTITILYGHIIQWFLKPLCGKEEFFIHLLKYTSYLYGFMCDMFFILSGFFMFFSFKKEGCTLSKFILIKISRLSPVLIFVVMLFFVLSCFHIIKFDNYGNFCALFFLNDSLSSRIPWSNGVAWYINVMFWCYILYCLILRVFDEVKVKYVIGIIIFFAYSVLLNKMNLYAKPLDNGIFTFKLIRGIAGMGMGYLIADFYATYNLKKTKISKKFIYTWTLCEIFFTYLLIKIAIIKPISSAFSVMIICFIILFYSFLYKNGIFSKLLDRNIVSFLGKYCYSIYMLQWVVFLILDKYLWRNPSFGAKIYPVANIIIGICLCILVGMITYHVVERPCKKLILKYAAKAFD